jgi:transposase
MLAGAAPIEASSGQVVRHRLNRGGDRQLNRARHTIVLLGERYHQPTKRDVARRTAEGNSQREIRRCPRAHRCPPAVPTARPDRGDNWPVTPPTT